VVRQGEGEGEGGGGGVPHELALRADANCAELLRFPIPWVGVRWGGRGRGADASAQQRDGDAVMSHKGFMVLLLGVEHPTLTAGPAALCPRACTPPACAT